MQFLIPMAGESSRFKEYGFEEPKYLINVLGKTLFQRAMESLPLQLATKLIFVLKKEHDQQYQASDMIHRWFATEVGGLINPGAICITSTLEESTLGQAHTCYLAKKHIDPSQPLIIYNIDTVFGMPFGYYFNTFKETDGVIFTVKKEGTQWSFAEIKNGIVYKTAEKKRISNDALVGFYHFSKANYFLEAFEYYWQQYKNPNNSDSILKSLEEPMHMQEFYVAPLYNYLIEKKCIITAAEVENFTPLGTPEEVFQFVKSQSNATKPRSFNKIVVAKQTILKSSKENFSKLRDEYYWYTTFRHNPLAIYTPVPVEIQEETNTIIIERFPLKSLSEIMVYEALTPKERSKLMDSVFGVLLDFTHKAKDIDSDNMNQYAMKSFCDIIYRGKTYERLHQVYRKIPERFTKTNFILNHQQVRCLEALPLDSLIEYVCACPVPGYFHGDFCYSNIMYSLEHDIVKLVDPRGDYIFGDVRYDWAKMLHSLSGYDLVVNDFYNIKISTENSSVETDIYWNNNINEQVKLRTAKYFNLQDYKAIRIIEALLFLTMIPLHSEDSKRQLMFYFMAMEKFDFIIKNM